MNPPILETVDPVWLETDTVASRGVPESVVDELRTGYARIRALL